MILILLTLPFTVTVADTSPHILQPGHFSQLNQNTLSENWKPLTFGSIEKHTDYKLVDDHGIKVIKAISSESASGLTNTFRFNPRDYPYLSWRWKVKNHLPGTDVTKKSGDDYAARIYVIFDYRLEDLPKKEQVKVNWYKFFNGKLPPLAAINYIWANKTPINKIVSSPYTKRVKMVVLQNRSSSSGQWYRQERNIYQDYKTAFGEEPRDVTNIAIMTDTDNTEDEVESYYGDITISKTSQLISQQ